MQNVMTAGKSENTGGHSDNAVKTSSRNEILQETTQKCSALSGVLLVARLTCATICTHSYNLIGKRTLKNLILLVMRALIYLVMVLCRLKLSQTGTEKC